MPDGTDDRLWGVEGEFRNEFDQQTLALPFFSARAATDRVVYVLDRRAVVAGRSVVAPSTRPDGAIAAATATSGNSTLLAAAGTSGAVAAGNVAGLGPGRDAYQRRESSQPLPSTI